MTNRSNHMPMLIVNEMMKSHAGLRRSFCTNNDSGRTMLQVYRIADAHHHWPQMRLAKNAFSNSLPLNHATNHSVMYAQPTTSEVKRQSFAAASRWLMVT